MIEGAKILSERFEAARSASEPNDKQPRYLVEEHYAGWAVIDSHAPVRVRLRSVHKKKKSAQASADRHNGIMMDPLDPRRGAPGVPE